MSSEQYPTSGERAHLTARRQALLDELMSPRFWLRQEERPEIIEYLNREYGPDEVQRMRAISEELMGRAGKTPYERYLELYRRFGAGRRFLKPGEYTDLSTKQAWLERYEKSGDPPLTPAQEERLQELTDLLMCDWPLWEDLVPENPPAEMPEIEIAHDYSSPLDEILTWGKHGDLQSMLRKLRPPEKYISDLIRMALDLELLWTSSDDPKVYAPTHALQLLGMLHAVEAAEPLLDLLDLDQDWVPGELPEAYAGIGPAAIPFLQRYLTDREQLEYGRVRATHALQKIAAAHPTERDRVVSILREQLRRGRQVDRGLNAFLISHLIDLQAEEALDEIKAAYLANKVDRMIVGNYNDVLAEFGLPSDPDVPSRPIYEDSPLKDIFDRMLGDVVAPRSRSPKRRQESEPRDKQKDTRKTRKRKRRRRKRKRK
ncbi:MAG: hypothetical protein ACE5LU_09410 [Anaerolineae bacterium]